MNKPYGITNIHIGRVPKPIENPKADFKYIYILFNTNNYW